MLPWRQAVPVVVLVVVAVVQIGLARFAALSAWKGGGFGMFSTLDDGPHRQVRIVVDGPDRSEEVAIAASIELDAVKAATLPTDRLLRRLAEAVAAREARYDRAVTRVRVTVWRHDVSRASLRVTPVVLRDYLHDVRP